MRNLITALCFVFGMFTGYMVAMVETNHDVCGNYNTTNSEWMGWLSIKDGVYRCFWVESRYPYRTRQGVVDVK